MNKYPFSINQTMKFEKLFSIVTMIAAEVLLKNKKKEDEFRQQFLDVFFTDTKTQTSAVMEMLLLQKYIISKITLPGASAGLAVISSIFITNIFNGNEPLKSQTKPETESNNEVINLADRRK